jgi:hypothetical protein
VQLTGENTATVKWRTLNSVTGKVRFISAVSPADITVSESIPGKDHEVKVSGLTPGTKYFYQIENIDKNFDGDQEMFFRTAPAKNTETPANIWILGDAGTGFSVQNKVRDAYLSYTGGKRPDLWLWLGDYAYQSGTDEEYQTNVFTGHYENLMKNVPVFSVPGNHDYANCGHLSARSMTNDFPYYRIFPAADKGELGGIPSGNKHYYSMDYSNIHLVFLDSYGCHTSPGSPMYTWLESDLAANTQKWTIVSFHHPPYTKGSHDSDDETELKNVRNDLVPLMEKYGTDLVLSGHSHTYERSFMISGHTGDAESFADNMKVQSGKGGPEAPYIKTSEKGTVYVVAGSGGKVSGTQKDWPHPAMCAYDSKNAGSLSVEITSGTLTSKFIGENGKVLDEFVIRKD